jgi:hypothetical protein
MSIYPAFGHARLVQGALKIVDKAARFRRLKHELMNAGAWLA